jgi:hypothetical protein
MPMLPQRMHAARAAIAKTVKLSVRLHRTSKDNILTELIDTFNVDLKSSVPPNHEISMKQIY